MEESSVERESKPGWLSHFLLFVVTLNHKCVLVLRYLEENSGVRKSELGWLLLYFCYVEVHCWV